MKLTLEFSEKDFVSFSNFEKAVKRQLGPKNIYVGTDSLNLTLHYPKRMAAMLRPYPENPKFEFELDNQKG